MNEPPERSGLEPAKLELDFALTAARWRVERLTLREAEDFATLALARGHDGPALCELAWPHDSWREVDPLFERALGEMGLAVPTEEEAVERFARHIATAIAAGTMSLFAGLAEVRSVCWPWCCEPHEPWTLTAFDPWTLGRYLDDLELSAEIGHLTASEQAHLERELSAMVNRLLEPATPPQNTDLAPALGGPLAPPEPGTAQASEEAEPARWQAGFELRLELGLRRLFSWRWRGSDRRG